MFPHYKSKSLSVLLTFFFVVGSVVGYSFWGGWHALQHYYRNQEKQEQVQRVLKTIKGPQDLIKQLKARVDQNPQSAKGWYLLGRLYSSQGEWKNACEALKTGYQLAPQDEKMSLHYAECLWQINEQHSNQQINALLDTTLTNNPQQPDAMAFVAMIAFKNQEYEKAIHYWEELLKLAPSNSDDARLIRQAIARAEKEKKSAK